MPYTIFIIQLINLSLACATGYVYYFHINLWYDQGIILFSTIGMLSSSATLFVFASSILKRGSEKVLSKFFHAVYAAVLFLGQLACFLFVLWQKTF